MRSAFPLCRVEWASTLAAMKSRSSLKEFFGLRRNLVLLLVSIFAIGAGEELWMRFLPKYL